MAKQEEIFAESEGDAWFARNFWKMEDQAKNDPVRDILKQHVSVREVRAVVEFGCANGWRLNYLNEYYGWYALGVDPSMGAIANGTSRFPNIKLHRGTMTAHPVHANTMQLVIYGFCLYVCDPEDLCEVVAQGNNILEDGGYLIIHDFDGDFPHSVPNKHVEGLMTYKMDWSQLWLANPAYRLVEKVVIPDGTAVWLLKKDQGKAFPCLSAS